MRNITTSNVVFDRDAHTQRNRNQAINFDSYKITAPKALVAFSNYLDTVVSLGVYIIAVTWTILVFISVFHTREAVFRPRGKFCLIRLRFILRFLSSLISMNFLVLGSRLFIERLGEFLS